MIQKSWNRGWRVGIGNPIKLRRHFKTAKHRYDRRVSKVELRVGRELKKNLNVYGAWDVF